MPLLLLLPKKNLCLLLVLLLCLFSSNAKSQSTAIGKEFFFSFLSRNHNNNIPTKLSIVFTVVGEATNSEITINPGNYTYTNLERGASVELILNQSQINAMMEATEGKDNQAIRLTSNVDIMLYAANYTKGKLPRDDGDATLILPTDLLGTEYVAISHNEDPNNDNSTLAIVATESDTYIDITPSADTKSFQANQTYTIQLQRGQRFVMRSKGDLTGTYIQLNEEETGACKPFAVFGGAVKSTVGDNTTAGHLYNQVFPISTLGRQYTLVPFEQDSGYYRAKMVAIEGGTEIFLNGNSYHTLNNPGDFLEIDLENENQVTASKPIQMAQLFQGFNNQTQKVDPFMIVLSADEHMVSSGSIPETTFLGLTGTITGAEFQTVIFFDNERNQYVHGSPNFEDNIKPFTPNNELSYASFFADEVLTETGTRGFIYYRYNLGEGPLVANLGVTINTGFTKLDTLSIVANLEQCLTEPTRFESYFSGKDGFDPPFDLFEWDFNDGTTGEGEAILHEFENPGTYNVRLIGTKSEGVCAEPDTAYFQIEVLEMGIEEITGADQVCPGATSIEYAVVGIGNNTYEWSVTGGTITENRGEEVVIDWDDADGTGVISVISKTPDCPDDQMVFEVAISDNIAPLAPEGVVEMCITDLQQWYVGKGSSSATYNWFVKNGQVLSGQGTDSVEIRWDGPGVGELYFEEVNSTVNGDCAGFSTLLSVRVYEELTLSAATQDAKCYEAQNGLVEFLPLGGKAPYTYLVNGDTLSTNLTNSLAKGTYDLIVIDALGCQVQTTADIDEPELLELEVTSDDALCFESATGQALAIATGGTAPYTYYWDSEPISVSDLKTGLDAGSHLLRIVDANGCEQTKEFQIDEPEAISISTSVVPTCPQLSTGSLLVEAIGGVGPYTFEWQMNPTQSTALAQQLAAGVYSVIVTDANGCKVVFDGQEVKETFPMIQVPNAFSPNGDGSNDTFNIVYNCSVPVQMRVYNQWGELVFVSDQIDQGWDGSFKGEPAPDGNYVYVINYALTVNGSLVNEVLRGTIRVFR